MNNTNPSYPAGENSPREKRKPSKTLSVQLPGHKLTEPKPPANVGDGCRDTQAPRHRQKAGGNPLPPDFKLTLDRNQAWELIQALEKTDFLIIQHQRYKQLYGDLDNDPHTRNKPYGLFKTTTTPNWTMAN